MFREFGDRIFEGERSFPAIRFLTVRFAGLGFRV
jgi:hypothetical protein